MLLRIRRRRQAAELPRGIEIGDGGRWGGLSQPLSCLLPFTEINIMEDGSVYPNCCPDWVEMPLGNLVEQTWEQVWNGDAARRLRRSSIDGSLRHCDQHWCPHIQARLRGDDDDRVLLHADRPSDQRRRRGEVSVRGPVAVGLHYDDSCNLACPSCRDGVHFVAGEAADRVRRIHEIVERDVLPHVERLSVTGTGDPFASRFFRPMLADLDADRFPRLQQVHLHTNAIMWTPSVWERMEGLHRLRLSTDISIDAARPETYHEVRQPARWDELMANLEFIPTIEGLESIGLSMTVSQRNWAEIVEFHDLAVRVAERAPDKAVWVEYKRVRRRNHHGEAAWSSTDLDQLPAADRAALAELMGAVRARHDAGDALTVVRDNLAELSA